MECKLHADLLSQSPGSSEFSIVPGTYSGDIQRLIFLKEEQVHQKAVSCEDSCSFSSLAAQDQYKDLRGVQIPECLNQLF
ncbi:mitochondrial import receptor subunit TOM7 homolog isoform X1 [Tursiops truncatus]|uniref:mitochondrial import receptor subunit TOM7 homolog isoform X1 n=1 Tax=Tursiops truncatus TaxID=9739 RepID=UPI003CCF5635